MGAICHDDGDDVLTVFPLPALDALSGDTQEQRRRLAETALTDGERSAMKAGGFCAIELDPDGEEPDPDGRWGASG